MIQQPRLEPVSLQDRGLRLEPLQLAHAEALREAAADGHLWNLRITSVPEPADTDAYVAELVAASAPGGRRLHFAVIEETTGQVLGTTGYHDCIPEAGRVEIGYTWYRASVQRTRVNTVAKLLLLGHAFDDLGFKVVGWRTDNFNFASQRAIERLGAKRDGVIRGNKVRRDGTVRDTVMYSMTAFEWPECRAQLEDKLANYSA